MDRTFHSGEEYVQFFERASGRPVESWNSSDGTLRALAILLALETAPETATLLIEEPEQGLHPWAIGTLVDHMRRVIAERNLQVVLTTHSQQVLDAVDPAEVLVATRTAGSGTQFKTIEATIGFHSIERGEVGRIWVSGALGGVPKILAIDEDEAGE
jgi:predicted ATPase